MHVTQNIEKDLPISYTLNKYCHAIGVVEVLVAHVIMDQTRLGLEQTGCLWGYIREKNPYKE